MAEDTRYQELQQEAERLAVETNADGSLKYKNVRPTADGRGIEAKDAPPAPQQWRRLK